MAAAWLAIRSHTLNLQESALSYTFYVLLLVLLPLLLIFKRMNYLASGVPQAPEVPFIDVHAHPRGRVLACARACVRACVRECVRAFVRVRARMHCVWGLCERVLRVMLRT